MPLTFVIPVSQGDIDRLQPMIDAMEFLGGLQNHAVLFCVAPSVAARATEQAARLRLICPNVVAESLPREPEPIGPFGAFNTIFRDSVEIVARRVQTPWMWWEVDVLPIRGGYADRLELEYHQKGQPFMGVRRKAAETMRNMDGSALPDNDPRAQGDYMVAVGIYPPNFKQYSTMYKYPDPTGNMPTDVSIRHEINRHLHHTELIGHHWGTGNYRREGGKIVCDDLQKRPGYPSYGGEVSDLAYVVHGCKDGSLAKLVLSETPPSAIVPTGGQAGDGAEVAGLRIENARVKSEIEELRADIQNLTLRWSEKENSYAAEIEELKEKLEAATVEAGAMETSQPTGTEGIDPTVYQAVLKLEKVLPGVGDSGELAKLAAKMNIKKAEVVKAAEAASDRFKIDAEVIERIAA